MAWGVTDKGFNRPLLPEIREEIIRQLRSRIGEEFSTDPSSLTGALIDVHAYMLAEQWEALEDAYMASYADTATGVNLDHVASLAGVMRRGDARSTAVITAYGDSGATLPLGAQIKNSVSQNVWEVVESIDIDIDAVNHVELLLTSVTESGVYSLDIDGQTYSYTAQEDDTEVEVYQGIMGQTGLEYSIEPESAGRFLLSLHALYPNTISVATGLGTWTTLRIGRSGIAATLEYISDTATQGALSILVEDHTGIDSVTNYANGTLGGAVETDAEFHKRFLIQLPSRSGSMIESINAALYGRIPGIETTRIYQNDKPYTDAKGMPKNSIMVLINGGAASDDDIAQVIFDKKAGGVPTWGGPSPNYAFSGTATALGEPYTVNFARPEPVYLWVKCVYEPMSVDPEIDPSDDQFPYADGPAEIKRLLMRNFEIGRDVRTQRFYGPVYSGVRGIASLDIQTFISTDINATPTYTPSNKTINFNQIAVMDFSRVTVEEAP